VSQQLRQLLQLYTQQQDQQQQQQVVLSVQPLQHPQLMQLMLSGELLLGCCTTVMLHVCRLHLACLCALCPASVASVRMRKGPARNLGYKPVHQQLLWGVAVCCPPCMHAFSCGLLPACAWALRVPVPWAALQRLTI
jgi:hypothetical protein